MMTKRVSVLLSFILVLSACASTPSDGTRHRQDLITADEIEGLNVSNLYQVVERLRPRWLEVRSGRSFSTATEVVVFQGQTYLGGLDMLRQLGPSSATAIRYLDGSTASATLPGLGSRHIEGAIVVNP